MEGWVIISMMMLCNDIVVIEYDIRISRLRNAKVAMEHENRKKL